MSNKFNCEIKVVPVVDWVNRGPQDKNCPPCLMSPLASHYLGILEGAGLSQQAAKLKSAWDTGEIKNIAKALDEIKKEVSPSVSEQLIECDCFAQSYEEK